MALDEREFRKLTEDFVSGRNPKAYIPICQHLRRQRRYAEALDYCQRGVSSDQRSLAGGTMLARLLADSGRYMDALAEVQRCEQFAPNELGLLAVKCQCQIRLRQLEDAAQTHALLDQLHPFDPQVQVLTSELRAAREQVSPRSSGEVQLPSIPAFLPIEEVAQLIMRQLGGVAKVHTIGIVDLDSGRSHSEGSPLLVETVDALFHDISISFADTEHGILRFAMLDVEKAVILMFHRDRRLVVLAMDPEMNFGRVYHRIVAVLDQYLAGVRLSGARPVG